MFGGISGPRKWDEITLSNSGPVTLQQSGDIHEQFYLHWSSPEPVYDTNIGSREYRRITRDAFQRGFRSFRLEVEGCKVPIVEFSGMSMFWIVKMNYTSARGSPDVVVIPMLGFRIPQLNATVRASVDFRPEPSQPARLFHADDVAREVCEVLDAHIGCEGRGPTNTVLRYLRNHSSTGSRNIRLGFASVFLDQQIRSTLRATDSRLPCFTTEMFTFAMDRHALTQEFLLEFKAPHLMQLLFWLEDAATGERLDLRNIRESSIRLNLEFVRCQHSGDFSRSRDKMLNGLADAPCHTITFCTAGDIHDVRKRLASISTHRINQFGLVVTTEPGLPLCNLRVCALMTFAIGVRNGDPQFGVLSAQPGLPER